MCLRVPITNPSYQLWFRSVGKCEVMKEQCGKSQSSQAHCPELWAVLLLTFLLTYFHIPLNLQRAVSAQWNTRKCFSNSIPFLPAEVPNWLPSKLHKHQRQHSRDKILQLQLRGDGFVGAFSWTGLGCLEASVLWSGWKGIAAVIQLVVPRQSGWWEASLWPADWRTFQQLQKAEHPWVGQAGIKKRRAGGKSWSSLLSTAVGLTPLKDQGITILHSLTLTWKKYQCPYLKGDVSIIYCYSGFILVKPIVSG